MICNNRATFYIIIAIIFVAFLLRIPILFVRYFDPDEFEHLHAAFSLYHGLIPYRDFFEHHTPLVWFLTAPLYSIFGANIPLLFAARVLMLPFTAGILYLTYLLGKRFYNADVAILAVLFLSYMIMFLEQTLEVRPDVPETLFWLLSLLFITRGIREKATKWYILSGLAMSISILFSQKALFALLGLAAVFLWLFLDRRLSREQANAKKRRVKEALYFGIWLSVPIALTCCFFLIYGALTEFINLNLFLNLRWKVRFLPFGYLFRSFAQNPFFWVLGITGLLVATFELHKRDERLKGNFAPLLSTYALLIGLFLIPVPYREYYVMLLPLLAIYCAYMLKTIVDYSFQKLGSSGRPANGGEAKGWRGRWHREGDLLKSILGVLAFIVALCYILLYIQPTLLDSKALYIAFWGLLLILIIFTSLKKKRCYVALIASIGIVVFPFQQTCRQLERSNAGQLADIRCIMSITSPRDTVLDGWSGFGVFRPHAYYYYFLHKEVRAMLGKEDLEDNLIVSLKEKRPKVIIYDSSIKALPKAVQDYIAKNYVYSGQGNIYLLPKKMP